VIGEPMSVYKVPHHADILEARRGRLPKADGVKAITALTKKSLRDL
jgi:hypothetical protein